MINQIEYDSLDDAKFAVKKNKVWGVLYFEEGYSESLGARIKMPDNLTERTLNISDVNIWQDMSSKYILYYYKNNLFYATRYIFYRNVKNLSPTSLLQIST